MERGSCMVCVPVTANTVDVMGEEMLEAARQGCDIIEIRLDLLQSSASGANFSPSQQRQDLETLLSRRPNAPRLPLIVTCRAAWEGGYYGGGEEERHALLGHAVQLGAEYVDIELKAATEFLACLPEKTGPSERKTRFIVSHHRFAPGPVDDVELGNVIARMLGVGADVAKFALMPQDIAGNATVFKILGRSPLPTVALLMGERGLPSRILAPKYGAFLTFASLSRGRESAPGQPPVRDLLQRYRFRSVGAGTRVFGVIGNPVAQSKSPVLHNAALQYAGVDAVYVPLLVDNLRSFLEAFNDSDYAGFSVTIPHKLAALECAHTVEPLAKSIGAVNTLIRGPDGRLTGYNTDCEAAISAIEMGLTSRGAGQNPLQGRVIVVLGAGGAARALAFGAKARGAIVLIANRSLGQAEGLAEAVDGYALPWELLQGSDTSALAQVLSQHCKESLGNPSAVIANSTPVGMHPNTDQSPVTPACLRHFALAFDAVYNPLRTKLLRDAEAAGAGTVSGVEMFVGQAAKQFELFTGLDAPVDLMRQVVLDSL